MTNWSGRELEKEEKKINSWVLWVLAWSNFWIWVLAWSNFLSDLQIHVYLNQCSGFFYFVVACKACWFKNNEHVYKLHRWVYHAAQMTQWFRKLQMWDIFGFFRKRIHVRCTWGYFKNDHFHSIQNNVRYIVLGWTRLPTE